MVDFHQELANCLIGYMWDNHNIIYPPTPAAQGGARKGKGFSDTALVAIFSVLYPPTPTSSTTTTTITTTQQAAAGSSRHQ